MGYGQGYGSKRILPGSETEENPSPDLRKPTQVWLFLSKLKFEIKVHIGPGSDQIKKNGSIYGSVVILETGSDQNTRFQIRNP